MIDENCIDLDQLGYRTLGKMLQGPVPDTIRARSLVDLENPDAFRFLRV